jgi:hypothetical protein
MRIVNFWLNLSNASPDTSQNVLCSPTKLPLIIHRSQPNLTVFVAHERRVRGMAFHVNPSNASRNTVANVFYSPITVLLKFDRLQAKVHGCTAGACRERYQVSGNLLQLTLRYNRKAKFYSNKVPYLLTDRNQTCTICSACAYFANYEVSTKSLSRKQRYSRKGTLFSTQSALIIDRSQPNFHRLQRMRENCEA